ncbi:MAG: RidA family protein [Phycisphaeraceae bacterium]|nr:MAG: RidA family protein [Phycisphaeraceae bacterium]
MAQTPTERLAALGLTLPPPPKPVAAYVPWVRTGRLVFISGQIPVQAGALMASGCIPDPVPVELAVACARQCALNAVAVAAEAAGGLDRIARIVRVGCFVASAPGFTDQPKVANGASELLVELFGDSGRHARAAVGSVALPLGAPVEVEMTVEVGP